MTTKCCKKNALIEKEYSKAIVYNDLWQLLLKIHICTMYKYKLACLSRTVENTYLYKYKSACLSRTVERSITTGSQPRNRKQTANA